MDPLEEEARLFAVTYGSEETPIPFTGPPAKVALQFLRMARQRHHQSMKQSNGAPYANH